MVWEVFSEFEAPDYTSEGVDTFKEFIVPEILADKIRNKYFTVYCCLDNDSLVGVLALRDTTHISLLFVKKMYHRKGIAKELLRIAIEDIINLKLDLGEVTVNSSPYAVKIYERFGFAATDTMQEKNGIKFTPMKRLLNISRR
jgi:ribosomal protein S18 acetylase RimI-like enzyme